MVVLIQTQHDNVLGGGEKRQQSVLLTFATFLQTTASADTVLSGTLQFGAIGNYEKTYQVVTNFWS